MAEITSVSGIALALQQSCVVRACAALDEYLVFFGSERLPDHRLEHPTEYERAEAVVERLKAEIIGHLG
jgi:hypothetical protein